MKIYIKLIFALLMGITAFAANASHFRGATVNWSKISGNTVEVRVKSAWRTLCCGERISLGDGTTHPIGTVVATATDLSGATYSIYENTITHTYSGPGNWLAGITRNCCRIGGIANASSGSFQVLAQINTAQLGGTTTTLPPLTQIVQGPNSITIPTVDPDSGPITCRLATPSESDINSYPSGLSVSSACVLTFDASAVPNMTRYAVQVIAEQGGLKSPLDFMLEVNAGLVNNDPPVCTLDGAISNTVSVGQSFSIGMIGSDPDGDSLTINHTGLPTGATLTPAAGTSGSSPMNGAFDWTPSTAGTAAVTVTFTDSHNQQAQCSFTIDSTRTLPIADAGADINDVAEGSTVMLDGSGSSDPEGDVLNYDWYQVGGATVPLSSFTAATPTFTGPVTTGNTTLTFELIVDDGLNYSLADSVDVFIVNSNTPPVADAGDDQTIKEGSVASLDGSNTYDLEIDPVTYKWAQVGGAYSVTLNPSDDVVNPSILAPAPGTGYLGDVLIFELVAFDGLEYSAPDTVSITVVENSAPIANAGVDQNKNEGVNVALSGVLSTDPDNDGLTYEWSHVSGPLVSLSDLNSATPTFTAPAVPSGGADVVINLTVWDNDPYNSKSSSDQVNIHLANINDPPSCDLGYASMATLWPPNHKMHQIEIKGVTDPDDPLEDILLSITSVYQDEPINGTGDGDSEPDAAIQIGNDYDTVLIRAERAGNLNGRVYHIGFTADDGFEACSGVVQVSVPHSRKGPDAVDDGSTVDSTTP